jgi:peptide deformylase
VNPIIVNVHGETTHQEGCLSFPGAYANIERHEVIDVIYWDVDVERMVEQQFTKIESICFQHELDHLNGIVFVDHLSTLKRSMVLKKLKKRSKV